MILIVTFFLLGAFLAWVLVISQKNTELAKTLTSNYLISISEKIDIINLLKLQNKFSKPLNEKYNEQLLRDISLIKKLNQTITDFPARETVGFCKFLKYKEDGDFKYNGNDAIRINLFKIANEYLESNRNEVFTHIKKVQQSFGGEGCQIAGGK